MTNEQEVVVVGLLLLVITVSLLVFAPVAEPSTEAEVPVVVTISEVSEPQEIDREKIFLHAPKSALRSVFDLQQEIDIPV